MRDAVSHVDFRWTSVRGSGSRPPPHALHLVCAGYEADTVAAMAGTVFGAYNGCSRVPRRLLADPKYHDRLLLLA